MLPTILSSLLLLVISTINASPLQHIDEFARARAAGPATSTAPACPGRQNAYSALLSYTAASSLCSLLLPIATVTITSNSLAGAAVNKPKPKSRSTAFVVVTKIATAVKVVTQTPANQDGPSTIKVTETAYRTTTVTNTIGGTPSSCLAANGRHKRSPAVYRLRTPSKLASPPNAPPAAVLCPGSDGQTITTSSTSYLIRCYLDHYGGDLGSAITPTFLDCLSACSRASGCLDVSYVPFDYYNPTTSSGTCWMKGSTLSPVTPNGAVWGAEVISISPPAVTTSTLPQQTLPSSLQSFGTSRIQAACSCLNLPTPTTIISSPPSVTPAIVKIITKTSIFKSTTTTTTTTTLHPISFPPSQPPQTMTTTTTLTTTSTTTTSLANPATATSTPTLFYLRTTPLNAYIAASLGGYDLVLSSLSTTPNSPNSNTPAPPTAETQSIDFHCPNCANNVPPALHPAAPASLFSLGSDGTLRIADVPGEAYAGYTLSDFNDDDEFYQQDLFGPGRVMEGAGECCWITPRGTLGCAWSGGGGVAAANQGASTGGEIIWAICYGGAVFRGTVDGLQVYEEEMGGLAASGQGVDAGCVRVDVDVIAA